MKLGCNTLLFNQLDLYGALQHISWAGYDGAELAFLGKMAQHIELRTDQEYIDEVKLIARKHGLKLLAIEASIAGPAESEGGLKIVVKLFELASKLNIPIISISSGGKAGDKEITEQVFKYLKKLSEEAESWKITLAVKPHVGASVYNTETVLQLLNKVDSKAIGINFDPSHLYRAHEDPAEAALKIGDRIVHSHFRDCPHRESSPGLPEQQIPGRGNIDIPRTL
ncbi:sugar phosphate isomerase/epimerase, partial [Candidatus Bathyarchaeota archaeon]|nr:sugar phosphate isomerase/epimerase [Candidatus Bathyarchaeota archaeon]